MHAALVAALLAHGAVSEPDLEGDVVLYTLRDLLKSVVVERRGKASEQRGGVVVVVSVVVGEVTLAGGAVVAVEDVQRVDIELYPCLLYTSRCV